MKNLVIFRFGTEHPVTGDAALVELLIEEHNALFIGAGIPGGLITLVRADLTPEQLIELSNRAEVESGDCLPSIAWEMGSGQSNIEELDLFKEVEKRFLEGTGQTGTSSKIVIKMTIDDVLDKINQSGLESLTEVELSLLKSQS
jgi:hypothetical protein